MSKNIVLEGRHALVTGASRGIGYAIAERLLDLGARVTLMGRDGASLKLAQSRLARSAATRSSVARPDQADPGQVIFVVGDISRHSDVQQAFVQARKQLGTIDILINNAGQALSERFDRMDEATWQQMIAVNLTGTFHCMQAALPDMLAGQWGRIVNVVSTAGLIGYPYVSAYCAAKHGVIGLTRSLALETARKGVTVNAVCPGYTETDIVHDAVATIAEKTGMSAQQATDKLVQRNPQGRLVQPAEVADAVVWLCQPAASSINGQAIPVDGGEVMAG